MTEDRFDLCLRAVLREEGGYADLSGDPGGATNMGITRATLARHRGRDVEADDVRALTRAEAVDIYREHYWRAIDADDLPAGLDLALFDDAVNSGPRQAVRDLQRALDVAVDGWIGPRTRAAIEARPVVDVVRDLCEMRRARLSALKTFQLFGRGWTNRIARIERQALTLATLPAASAEPAVPAAPNLRKDDMAQMQDSKPFWASQTIWSSIAVIGSSLTGALIAWKSNDMAGFGASLTALLGGVNAIVGRVRGTTPIG